MNSSLVRVKYPDLVVSVPRLLIQSLPDGVTRQFWKDWVVLSPLFNWKSSKVTKRANFYVVWRGVSVGVFYQWSDCRSAIAGVSDPGLKGFETLSAAYEFFRKMKRTGQVVVAVRR